MKSLQVLTTIQVNILNTDYRAEVILLTYFVYTCYQKNKYISYLRNYFSYLTPGFWLNTQTHSVILNIPKYIIDEDHKNKPGSVLLAEIDRIKEKG